VACRAAFALAWAVTPGVWREAAAVLALALAAFAPGLIGFGLSANLSRVLYARHRNRAPALAIAAGWLLVIVANAAIVPFVPASQGPASAADDDSELLLRA